MRLSISKAPTTARGRGVAAAYKCCQVGGLLQDLHRQLADLRGVAVQFSRSSHPSYIPLASSVVVPYGRRGCIDCVLANFPEKDLRNFLHVDRSIKTG